MRTDRKGLHIVPFEHLRNNFSLVLIGNRVTFENCVQILNLSVQLAWVPLPPPPTPRSTDLFHTVSNVMTQQVQSRIHSHYMN